jgi:ABC-type glycerol-3-phosphate transport system permease component
MFQLPFAWFMMRDTCKAVPRELEEARLAVPCMLIFLLLQRHDARGFMSGAIRG